MQSCVVDNHTTRGLGAIYVKGNNFGIALTNMSFNTAKNGGAFNNNGYMVTGTKTIDGKIYSFRKDGSLVEQEYNNEQTKYTIFGSLQAF